jgi:hypothetical protein
VDRDSTSIAAQVRALLETTDPQAPAAGQPEWARAMVGEMEHVLVSGYACALTLDGERLRLEDRLHELALRVDGNLEQASELTRVRRDLRSREGELDGLRTLLGELRTRVADRRASLER